MTSRAGGGTYWCSKLGERVAWSVGERFRHSGKGKNSFYEGSNAGQYDEDIIRTSQVKKLDRRAKGNSGLEQPVNESRLYDLVKNEGEDGSDGQERLDSCQGWEGIATL